MVWGSLWIHTSVILVGGAWGSRFGHNPFTSVPRPKTAKTGWVTGSMVFLVFWVSKIRLFGAQNWPYYRLIYVFCDPSDARRENVFFFPAYHLGLNRPERVPSTSVNESERPPLRVLPEPPTASRSRGVAAVFPGYSRPPALAGAGTQNHWKIIKFLNIS